MLASSCGTLVRHQLLSASVRTPHGKTIFIMLPYHYSHIVALSEDVLYTSLIAPRRALICRGGRLHSLSNPHFKPTHTSQSTRLGTIQWRVCQRFTALRIVRSAALIISFYQSVGRGRSMSAEPYPQNALHLSPPGDKQSNLAFASSSPRGEGGTTSGFCRCTLSVLCPPGRMPLEACHKAERWKSKTCL